MMYNCYICYNPCYFILLSKSKYYVIEKGIKCLIRSNITIENIDSKKELMKIINVLGQEVNISDQRREVLFYIYNDGSVQKKINF